MIIYEQALLSLNPDELKHFAYDLAKKLFPQAKQILSKSDSDPIHLDLQLNAARTPFEPVSLTGRAASTKAPAARLRRGSPMAASPPTSQWRAGFRLYDRALDPEEFQTALSEMARAAAHSCIAARSFPKDVWMHVKDSSLRIRLFSWHPIRSEDRNAVLVREVRRQIHGESAPSPFSPIKCGETLSAPELIALTRLGMELRRRRLNR